MRQGDVLKWALDSIALSQRALLMMDRFCRLSSASPADAEKLEELSTEISIATEQGRLFFRNTNHSYKIDKESAYTGHRPEILDQLVILAKICRSFADADEARRWQLRYLAIRAEQKFVSLAQSEVGRARSASALASAAGQRVDLDYLAAKIDPLAMDRSRHRFR